MFEPAAFHKTNLKIVLVAFSFAPVNRLFSYIAVKLSMKHKFIVAVALVMSSSFIAFSQTAKPRSPPNLSCRCLPLRNLPGMKWN